MEDAAEAESFPVPELYFGTVRAIGTPLKTVVAALDASLEDARFKLHEIKVSHCLEQVPVVRAALLERETAESPYQRYQRLRAEGFWLRSKTKRRDAIIGSAIAALNETERDKAREQATNSRGIAYLFRSVHHPKEAERLRKLYDRQLFLISVYSSQEDRYDNLKHRLDEGYRQGGQDPSVLVEELMRSEDQYLPAAQRYDKTLSGLRQYGTDIPKTFQHGDLFLDVNDANNAQHVERFLDLIFGHPFHTPTRDEVGMSDAFAAKLESGNLARQVGASVLSEDGELLTTGTNDVPRPGGGVYRSGDLWDFRDYNDGERLKGFRRGWDASDTTRRYVLTDLLRRLLADPEWLRHLDQHARTTLEGTGLDATAGSRLAEVLESAVNDAGDSLHNVLDVEALAIRLIESDLIWDAQFFDVLEYGRTMHAEMDAITSAARKGVSLRNATLYCTTLPCHECARLIIGAGIRRVIFIEPFEKSRIRHMYDSEINFTTLAESRRSDRGWRRNFGDEPPELKDRVRVDFVPYVGISPRRFHELFSFVPRKLEDQEEQPRRLSGKKAVWDKATSDVRETIASASAMQSLPRLEDLLAHERELVKEFREAIDKIQVDEA